MRIHGRPDRPWDLIFAFHFREPPGATGGAPFAKRLRKLVEPAARQAVGSPHAAPDAAPLSHCDEDEPDRRILGRFLSPTESAALLSAWNRPDGDLAFMCFDPNHGFATLQGGRIDWWTEICFYCANAAHRGPQAGAGEAGERLLPDGFKGPGGLEPTLLGLLPERDFPLCI